MKSNLVLASGAIAFAVIFSLGANPALAAKANSVYAQKKAECKQEAKAKHFGVHFVKRDRWIKNCVAGSRT